MPVLTVGHDMKNSTTEIEIVGTSESGTFLARIKHDGRTAFAYYPDHLGDVLLLHEYADFFTRFVVFYANDEKMHQKCFETLKRKDIHILDHSGTGLVGFFSDAMKAVDSE